MISQLRSELCVMKRARLMADLLGETCLSTSGSRLGFAALLAAGTLLAARPAYATSYFVASDLNLRDAISSAKNGDIITFTANITLSANLPQVQSNVTINGGNFTLSGNNQYRGLYVASGTVAINNLNIVNATAQGGNGGNGYISSSGGRGGGGGGGAGLGGALFIASAANVTVSNVALQANRANGGAGSGVLYGGAFQTRTSGGGGGLFGNGGDGGTYLDGDAGAGGGGKGGGGPGAFGGGGGGSASTVAGAGGFGGGGGGTGSGTPGAGGFGGGAGAGPKGGGGGGMGGAIFVQQGGTLNLAGTLNMSGGSVAGGSGNSGGQNGQAFGSGMFLQGNGSFSTTPGAGQTQTIGDAIVDQTGVAGSGGSWSLVKNGAGTTVLTGANAYSGGTTVNAGILQGNAAGLQGNIINNASVIFDQTGSGTYAGNMSGTGSLTKIGTGDVSLKGTNTYSGGTTVTGGALLVASAASLGPGSITLNNGSIGLVRDASAQTINRAITITNNGGFSGVSPNAPTWSGVISGNGTLVKSGQYNVILSGANTYSGGTTVTGGVLRVDTDANLGAGGTGITLNGGSIGTTKDTPAATSFGRTITLAGNGGIDVALHPVAWSGNIGGTGQFIKSGDGELELTGANTYLGGTEVDRGTLRLSSDDKLGAAGTSINLNGGSLRASETFTSARAVVMNRDGGAILVDVNKVFTLSGIVSSTSGWIGGPGNLTKVGDGTLVLTGANTYEGNIYVNGGTVQGNTTSLRNNIFFDLNTGNLSARSVTFDQAIAGSFAGNISGLGSLAKTGAGTLILTGANNYSGGTTVSAGTLQGTSSSLQGNILNNATLIFDQSTDGTYAAVMSGTGTLTKNGTGKLSLPGTQTFTGATNVNAGNLNVNGSLASSSVVNVNKGGTLSGNGNFGNVNDNGGTVSPGNSIGTMHINGNFNMSAGSTYYVELNGQASDLITVTGTANIQSSVFEIAHDSNTASAPVLPGKTYTLLTTGGGLTVTSPTVAIADFPFLAFTLSADAFNGYLTTSRSLVSFADLASTSNEKAVANALETTAASNPLWQQVVGASEAQARAAFASLSNASIHANVAGVLSEQSQVLRDAVTGRLRQDFAYGVSLAQAGNVLSYADEAPRNAYASLPFYKAPPLAAASRPAQVYSVWAQALGSQGTLKGDGNAAQTDHSLGGVVSGIDITFNGTWRVGLAGGYSHSSFKSPAIVASGSADSYHVALYGGGQLGAWGLRGGASFSWNEMLTSRQVAVVNVVETQRGDYALKTTQVFGEIGHTYAFRAGTLEPFLNLAYVRVDGGINELGLAAMTGSTTLDTAYTTLGLRGATALTETLTARGTLGWRHALGDVTPVATLAFQSGSPFALAGSPIARDALVAEAGLDLAVAADAFLGVSWSGQFADRSHNNMVKGSFSWRF